MATPSLSDDTAKAVLRQVEFYFSDSNIPRDTFLKKKISESDDGMVCLALICSFSKMRSHLNLRDVKAEDVPEATLKAVAETLRTSSSLKVSEDGKKVGRAAALLEPNELIEQLDSRTIAASPFEFNVKMEDVQAFFGQYAKVNSVRLPRHVANKKYFCGTALIEFSAEEDAQKVLEQSLVFAGAELELKPKKDFDVIREEEAEEFGDGHPVSGSNGDNHSNADDNYPKGLLVAFSLKKISAVDSAEPNGSDDLAKEVGTEKSEEKTTTNGKDNEEKTDDKHAADETGTKSPIPKNEDKEHKSTASAFKDDFNVVMREDLKEAFKKFGAVKFVDFKIGENKGYIRFDTPEAAQKARAAAVLANEGGLVVKNFIATLEPVTGDAEKEYWSLLRGGQEKFRGNKRFQGRSVLTNIFYTMALFFCLDKQFPMKFVDFKIGEDKGYIRFDTPEAAQKARAAAVLAKEGGLVVKNFIATLEPVTGDAEKEYWSLLRGGQEKFRGNKRFQGRGGKNYRGGKRGWGRENHSPNKARRT